MKQVTTKSFQSEVLDSTTPVIVDIAADWCTPCKFLHPILEVLSKEYLGVKFVTVDADANQEILYRYGLTHVPTIFRVENGEVVRKVLGFQPKSSLVKNLGLE
jgi:thioredoxin 1